MKKIRIIKEFYNLPVGESLDIGEYTITAENLVGMGFAEWVDEPEELDERTVQDVKNLSYDDKNGVRVAPQLPSKLKMEDLSDYNTALHRLMHRVNALIDVVAYLLAKDK